MITNFHLYLGLPDGLIQFPIPDKIRIAKKKYVIPKSLDEFTKSICYGQRLFFVRKEDNDFGVIFRIMNGYYYSIVTGKKWDEDSVMAFGKVILNCHVTELYPVAMYLIKLVGEMIEKEQKMLHQKPSKMELAAGIEKLNVFADMTALDFLRDAMKITIPEILLTPYNECLVRFMMAKEQADFQDRYFELMKEETQSRSKYANK